MKNIYIIRYWWSDQGWQDHSEIIYTFLSKENAEAECKRLNNNPYSEDKCQEWLGYAWKCHRPGPFPYEIEEYPIADA